MPLVPLLRPLVTGRSASQAANDSSVAAVPGRGVRPVSSQKSRYIMTKRRYARCVDSERACCRKRNTRGSRRRSTSDGPRDGSTRTGSPCAAKGFGSMSRSLPSSFLVLDNTHYQALGILEGLTHPCFWV